MRQRLALYWNVEYRRALREIPPLRIGCGACLLLIAVWTFLFVPNGFHCWNAFTRQNGSQCSIPFAGGENMKRTQNTVKASKDIDQGKSSNQEEGSHNVNIVNGGNANLVRKKKASTASTQETSEAVCESNLRSVQPPSSETLRDVPLHFLLPGAYTSSVSAEAASFATSLSSEGSSEGMNQISEIPPMRMVEEPTLEEPNDVDQERGEDSDKLSDEYDDAGGFVKSLTNSTSTLFKWVSRIAPLLQRRRTRRLALFNFILTIINSIGIISAFTLFGIFFHLQLQVLPLVDDNSLEQLMCHSALFLETRENAISSPDGSLRLFRRLSKKYFFDECCPMRVGLSSNPCYFAYHEWSECSELCWKGSGDVPYMTRRVRMDSIVQSRGTSEPCPSNLDQIVDRAPCNTYRCPTNISSYNFTERCFRRADGIGYRIRDIPLDDRLIAVDANLTEDCS